MRTEPNRGLRPLGPFPPPLIMATETAEAPPLDPDRQLTLGELIGHARTAEYLRQCVRENNLSHALLLAGPTGVGKKTLAWALVREIVAAGADPAGHRGSLKVARGTHPDLHVIDSTQTTSRQITVDLIRGLDDWTATSPLEAPFKIAIIEPAEAMNASAANALLKLLEEPPRHLILILISNDPALLLPTVRSRCSLLNLEPVEPDELAPWLMKRERVGEEKARLIARLAEGRPGRAVRLAGSSLLEAREELLGEIELLAAHGFATIFGVADRWRSHGDLRETLSTLLMLLRDLLLVKLELGGVINTDLLDRMKVSVEKLSPAGILGAARSIELATEKAGGYYTPQAQAHFLETVAVEVGRELRTRG